MSNFEANSDQCKKQLSELLLAMNFEFESLLFQPIDLKLSTKNYFRNQNCTVKDKTKTRIIFSSKGKALFVITAGLLNIETLAFW